MARIRTIKPEFFTSEDIVGLSPLARLLYIASWCEADKEGRLAWKPKTMKLRYFPADNCDMEAMAEEIVDAGLIVPYGDGLAYIPHFRKHQHINPRETDSNLPAPADASARVDDASARVSDAQGGREGKGREGKDDYASGDAHLPALFIPLVDGVDYEVSKNELIEFRAAYPRIKIEDEIRKARAWCVSNPGKRKTLRGVSKFLNSWLSRANSDAPANPAADRSTLPGGGRRAL